ncbi:3-hydroxyacyl-CoA dehydrogenase family protein [Brasilonema bromeliae]|nr:3-hydroxyacyl-CoA dehydrogenase NAD-binding domain-containing protein [Brasilonema bromeliae]
MFTPSENEVENLSSKVWSVEMMKIQVVGVVGAGVMGIGVAQNLAQTSHQVILVDISEEILDKAKKEIKNNIRFQGFFNKNEKAENPDNILHRIKFSTNYKFLESAEFVIENATEKWDIKKEIYAQLDAICPPETVFAANTSAISITRIGSATKRADKIIGMHFMNPVPMKPMVEMIRGYHTSDETISTAKELLAQMGKEGILVNDSPGFVSNRVLMLTINEAIFLIQDQVASVSEVDRIFKTCFGHKMGPLETADLIGLDTILFSIEVLYESFNDSKYRPCPLLKKMVDAGLYGRKSGQGFYTYNRAI